MKQKNLFFIIICLILILFLLIQCPWVNESFVENRIDSTGNNEYNIYYFKKVPFGAKLILYYTVKGRINGTYEKIFTTEYILFSGTRKNIYDPDLEKIKPKTEVILETEIIDHIKAKFPEVKDINKAAIVKERLAVGKGIIFIDRGTCWGGQHIYGDLMGTDYKITFWKGWGDCPSGCILNHWWYFKVTSNGDINKIGDEGDPIRYST